MDLLSQYFCLVLGVARPNVGGVELQFKGNAKENSLRKLL
jgi:hypothetical protein